MSTAWLTLLLAIPVLMGGEWLVRRIYILARFNIPAPVVGGMLISLALLFLNISGYPAGFETRVDAKWWTWLVTPETEWASTPSKPVTTPFLVAFFTCIGLNASWLLVKRAGGQVLLFLVIASVLAVLQNGLGAALAVALGENPLLGLICGSTTLTGGHGTAMGFAGEFEKAGLPGAATLGMAAASFGLVAGGLLGGPLGGALIRKRALSPSSDPAIHLESGQTQAAGIIQDIRSLATGRMGFLMHFLLLLVCIKAGAWLSVLIQLTGISFPVYIGSMVVGLIFRNVTDFAGRRWVRTETVDVIASVALGIFLSAAMMSLNLSELAGTALPMLIILAAQIVLMTVFAWFVSFRVMGGDFDAAVMAAGHCGFGLGATSNAVANMKAIVQRYGPAPRAFLIVPLVGGFLIDLVNVTNITAFLNFLGS